MTKYVLGAVMLAALFLFAAPRTANAQYAYGSSSISYNPTTKQVFGYSRTSVDYYAGAYYDPYVEGFLYSQYSNYPVSSGGNRGYENWVAAEVRTSTNSTPSTRYDVISDHYVIAWYSVSVTICDYYGFFGGCGYDPYGFSFLGGGRFGGFWNFFGPGYGGYVPERTFYLGSTGIAGITPPPDTCPKSPAEEMSGDVEYEYASSSSSYQDTHYFVSGSSCPEPTPTPPAISAQVIEVGFTGDYEVKKFAKGDVEKQVSYDPDGATPTWKKDKNPKAPVAYKMGQQPVMFATVALSPAVTSPTTVRLRVKKGTDVVATKDNVTLSGASVRVTDIPITAALESPQKVKRGDYKFAWEISFDGGGSWKPMGTSGTHEIHWLYSDPIPVPFTDFFGQPYDGLFDLTLDNSTGKTGDGSSDLDEIIRRISKKVGENITYKPNRRPEHRHPLRYFSDNHAQCADNALILRGLLRSIGINATVLYYWGGNPDTRERYTYRFGPSSDNPPSFQVDRPLEDGIEPDPHFSYHAMVDPAGSDLLYDPSYRLPGVSRVDFIEVFDKPNNSFKRGAEDSWPFVVESTALNPVDRHTDRHCTHSNPFALFPNPIDDSRTFVAQQYMDLLGREPDTGGLDFWTSQITNCGSDSTCVQSQRLNVARAFFLSREFKETGLFVHLLYKISYARQPEFFEFLTGQANVGSGFVDGTPGAGDVLEANQASFVAEWVEEDDFEAIFDQLSNEQFIDRLFANAGVTPSASERQGLINGLNSGADTRGTALRKVINNAALRANEDHSSFVLMEYFGFLRRNPYDPPDSDMSGYNFWLGQYNSHNDQNAMIQAFILSTEYRSRFGQP
jgi:hypothetical protein